MLHELISIVVDLVAWLLRSLVDLGSVRVPITNQVYILPLLILPFAAALQFRVGHRALGLLLLGLLLYLVFNRLTTFTATPVTVGTLAGNVLFFLLGLYNLWPRVEHLESAHG